MKNDTSKHCALYVRVSTADQGERYSLPSQEKALREKATREGFTVREDYIFVDKHTGKVAERPAFDRLNRLVASGAVGAVFIFSVDRFARRTEDALRLAREYKRHAVKLDFVEAPFEDTPTGRFTFTQLAAFAELWGEKILADSARGRKQKLESGKLTHGSAKFGYVYIDKRQKDGARFEIDPVKSQVVKDVFRWRLEGQSMYAIAARLNAAGILSAGYNGKPGGLWSRNTVRQMLTSRTYIGQHVCSGVTVQVPRIIDIEVFTTIQQRMDADYRRMVGRPSNKYLLRGYLWCGRCGRRCTTFPNTGYPFYRCGNVSDKPPHKRRCLASGVSTKAIEEAAWDATWTVLKNPALLLQLWQAYYDSLSAPEAGGMGKLEQEAARLRQRVTTTQLMLQDGLLPYAKGAADIKKANERIRQIEGELSTAGRLVSLPSCTAAETACREITNGAEPETYTERREILERLIDLRMADLNGKLEIEGKVPVLAERASRGGGQKNRDSRVRPNPKRECQHNRPGKGRIPV